MKNDLIKFREKAHISRYELAKKLSVTPNSIYNWEKGISVPNSEAIYKMSKVFGTSTDNIFLALHTTKIVKS